MRRILSWLLADQAKATGKHVVTLVGGERVIIDNEITVRRIYSIFYWVTNLFSLSGLASTAMETYLGFWTAYTLALGSLMLGTLVLVLGRSRLCSSSMSSEELQGISLLIVMCIDCRKPEASFRAKLLSALSCAIRGGFRLDAAEPAYQLENHGRTVAWDEKYVEDLRQALSVCKIW